MAYKIGQVIIDNTELTFGKLTEDNQIDSNSVNILDVINGKSDYSNVFCLYRLGIQARPGSKIAIGSEVIWIGRSGTYEICHELVQVTDLKLLSPTTYIIDFKY